jgi:hypothetical protein
VLPNVAIYYVQHGAEGSVTERLEITKTGEIPKKKNRKPT